MKFQSFILIGTFLIGFLNSCQKEELPFFEDTPGAYFDVNSTSYSFMEDPSKDEVVVNLGITISGYIKDYDRKIKAVAVPDSTTATSDMYQVMDGCVVAGSNKGLLPIVISRKELLEKEIVRVYVRLVENENFEEFRLGYSGCSLYFTSKLIKPANWDGYLYYYFRDYSTLWWSKIVEWTGRGSLPYWPENPDRETWWMTSNDIRNYKRLVIKKFEEYNADPNNPPLIHDDGEKVGQPIMIN